MLLLDTCTLIWLATDVARLSERARTAINNPQNVIYVSAISAWEIGIGVAKGRLQFELDSYSWFEEATSKYGIKVLSIDWSDALRSTELPKIHSDPADRIIIAVGLSHQLTVVTPDDEMPKYPGLQVLW